MAYWLSKLLPLALLPLGFSLILLVVGLVGRWRWSLLTAALLLLVLSMRKFGMDTAADVGDKSVFAYLDAQRQVANP